MSSYYFDQDNQQVFLDQQAGSCNVHSGHYVEKTENFVGNQRSYAENPISYAENAGNTGIYVENLMSSGENPGYYAENQGCYSGNPGYYAESASYYDKNHVNYAENFGSLGENPNSYALNPRDCSVNPGSLAGNEYDTASCSSIDYQCIASSTSAQGNFSVKEPQSEPHLKAKDAMKKIYHCRLCANHGLHVRMKGHKYFCSYSKCRCHLCTITKKCQTTVKTQQRMAREAEQKNPDIEQFNASWSSSVENEYPTHQKEEMMKDLADVDSALYDEFNKLCKRKNPNSGNL